MSTNLDQVQALEERRCAAMVAADRAAMEELFADGARYTHSYAGVDTKESIIDLICSGSLVYRGITKLSQEWIEHENAVVCIGQVQLDLTSGGVDRTVKPQATMVWAREGDGWRFVVWQSTTIPS